MVRVHPDPPKRCGRLKLEKRDRAVTVRERIKKGAIAHLVERLPCTQEVVGSSPTGSTKKDKGGESRPRGAGKKAPSRDREGAEEETERKDEERQRSRDPKYLRLLDI